MTDAANASLLEIWNAGGVLSILFPIFFFNLTQVFGGYEPDWWGEDERSAVAHFLCYSASLLLFVALLVFGNALLDRSNGRPLYVKMRNYFDGGDGGGGASARRNEGLLLATLFLFGCFSLLASASYFFFDVDLRHLMDGNFGEALFQPARFLPLTFFLWGAFCLTFFHKLSNSSALLPRNDKTISLSGGNRV